MATGAITPPAGFELETQSSGPTPPEGFEIEDQPAQQSMATISAQKQPQGFGEKVSAWAENVANDIKDGNDLTGVGSVLKKMGAHGVYSGNSEAVGDFMASLPLGLLRMGKGGGEAVQGKP